MGRLKPPPSVALHQRLALERARRPQRGLRPRRLPLLEARLELLRGQLPALPQEQLRAQQQVLRRVRQPARRVLWCHLAKPEHLL